MNILMHFYVSKSSNKLVSQAICLFSVVCMFTLSTVAIQAQNDDTKLIEDLKNRPRTGFAYASMGSGNPQGEFQTNIGSGGFGLALGGGYSFEKLFSKNNTPVNFSIIPGLEIGYCALTKNKQFARFSPKYDSWVYTNSVVPINVFTRFQFDIKHWIFPYAEFSAGLNVYSASTDGEYDQRVKKEDGTWVTETRTDEIYSDRTVFTNYGIATGIMIKVVENITLPNSVNSMLLDIKARYLYGSPKDYQKVKDVDKYGTTIYEQFTNAGTDMLFVHMGIAYRF